MNSIIRDSGERSVRVPFLLTALVGTLLMFLLAAAPVAAEEAGHGAEAAHEAKSPITAEKREVDLAAWTLVTFVIFVLVLGKFAWGPLVEGLDRRETNLLQHLADAESARAQAERMLASHSEKLDKVQEEIRELLAEARRDAEHTKSDIVATAQKEAEASRQRAVQEIERARDQALDELFAHMGRCVSQATEEVIGRSLSGPDHERLIQEALTKVTHN